MRGTAWLSGAVALAVAFGCGGSTSSDPGDTGGTPGTGGGSATGGMGGTGNVGGGVGGGLVGGSGGACGSSCGPDGAPCCEPFSGCGVSGPGGSLSCECTSALVWQCVMTGGAGGVGGCDPSACGPHGAPCCQPGSGCGTAGGGAPPLSCSCTSAGVWDCVGGFGGSGGGGGGFCNGPTDCAAGTTCCSGKCVNLYNDPFNCAGCGNTCAGFPPYCAGQCTQPPCWAPTPPPPGAICCGQNYCKPGMLCCDVQGPGPSGGPTCFSPTPDQPTCPIGCPLCQ